MSKGFTYEKGITSRYGSMMNSTMTQRKVRTKELGSFKYAKGITSRYGNKMNLKMTQRKVSTEKVGILRVKEDRDRLIDRYKDR